MREVTTNNNDIEVFKETDEICKHCGGLGYVLAYDHTPGCHGDCENWNCPVQVQQECDICFGFGKVLVPAG